MEWTPVKSRNKSFDNLPGDQFEVVEFQLPDFKAGGILPFLQSGYVKGIRGKVAQAIYDAFVQGEEK